MIIDPPSGWMYGFPRKYDEETDGPMEEFLLHHGYPEHDIDYACKHMRIIFEESEFRG